MCPRVKKGPRPSRRLLVGSPCVLDQLRPDGADLPAESAELIIREPTRLEARVRVVPLPGLGVP